MRQDIHAHDALAQAIIAENARGLRESNEGIYAHPDTLIPRAVVEQALKKHETNCCMFERGVQTLDDVLASRATFLAALQPQAAAEPHTFNDESPFCVKCGSTGEAEVDPVAHILPRMLKILKFKTMPVPVDPLPYDSGEEKTVPLYTTPPAAQAALTVALSVLESVEALLTSMDIQHLLVYKDVADAIAQIEALKGPTP